MCIGSGESQGAAGKYSLQEEDFQCGLVLPLTCNWGSFTNLMGDVFDLAGEKLAKYIRKAIKKGYVAE